MRKIQIANSIIDEVKAAWNNGLLVKEEKLALISEAEVLADHNGLGIFLDGFLEQLKANVKAES